MAKETLLSLLQPPFVLLIINLSRLLGLWRPGAFNLMRWNRSRPWPT